MATTSAAVLRVGTPPVPVHDYRIGITTMCAARRCSSRANGASVKPSLSTETQSRHALSPCPTRHIDFDDRCKAARRRLRPLERDALRHVAWRRLGAARPSKGAPANVKTTSYQDAESDSDSDSGRGDPNGPILVTTCFALMGLYAWMLTKIINA